MCVSFFGLGVLLLAVVYIDENKRVDLPLSLSTDTSAFVNHTLPVANQTVNTTATIQQPDWTYRASRVLTEEEILDRHTEGSFLQHVYATMFTTMLDPKYHKSCVFTAAHVGYYVQSMLLRYGSNFIELNNPVWIGRGRKGIETREIQPLCKQSTPVKRYRYDSVSIQYQIHNPETATVQQLGISLTGEAGLCFQAAWDVLTGALECASSSSSDNDEKNHKHDDL